MAPHFCASESNASHMCRRGLIMLQSFASKKEQVLRRADKSKKGDVDPPIFALVGAINSSPSFVTTSSCSGRTVVFAAAHQRV